MPDNPARGRLPGEPVAIVDIGSNSVRLVSYESRSRAPTPTFNEKALCGLGRGVAMTGLLHEDAIAKALAALQRFRVLCDTMRIDDVRGLATAAVRDAANGAQFLDRAERALGRRIELLSGQQEARLSALGVVSSIYNADGVVGDLGGGSLELTDVNDGQCCARDYAAARGPVADGPFGTLAEKGGQDRPRDARDRQGAARADWANVLCGWRHLAGSGPPAYATAAVSNECDAQLRDPVARRSRIRQARRTDRGGRAPVDRVGLVSSQAAAGIWSRSAGRDHSPG